MGLPVLHEDANITIATHTSQSAAVDCTERIVVGIYVPSGWTAADITFLASIDGSAGSFKPVQSPTAEAKVTVPAAADCYVQVDPNVTRGIKWLKLRSGTAALPVAQLADRALKVATVQDLAG